MDARERAAKERAAKAQGEATWVWSTDKPIPPLPEVMRSNTTGRSCNRSESLRSKK